MQLNHKALWVNLTFELVKTKEYDEANCAHIIVIEPHHLLDGE